MRALAREANIYALSGFAPGAAAAFADAHIRPVIGSLHELAEWDAYCSTSGWRRRAGSSGTSSGTRC